MILKISFYFGSRLYIERMNNSAIQSRIKKMRWGWNQNIIRNNTIICFIYVTIVLNINVIKGYDESKNTNASNVS